MEILTYNQINNRKCICNFCRLYHSELTTKIYERYREKERNGISIPYPRRDHAEVFLKNNIVWHAWRNFEKFLTHIPGSGSFRNGVRHFSIHIPYFEQITTPSGNPNSVCIWVNIDPLEGIKMTMPTPTGNYKTKFLKGNKRATIENITADANTFFLSEYLPDTIKAAQFQYKYRLTKKEAIRAYMVANKTGYYIAWRSTNGEMKFESATAPAIDIEKVLIKRLKKKKNIKVVSYNRENDLLKLLKRDRSKKLKEAHATPNFWDMLEEYEMEHDTEEELENFVVDSFSQYPKGAILI